MYMHIYRHIYIYIFFLPDASTLQPGNAQSRHNDEGLRTLSIISKILVLYPNVISN